MTKPAPERWPERWIVMLNRNATAAETDALAAKIDELGAKDGFKTVDSFPGAILVEANEAFVRQLEKQFANDIRLVSQERQYKLPDTRPRLRKPPGL